MPKWVGDRRDDPTLCGDFCFSSAICSQRSWRSARNMSNRRQFQLTRIMLRSNGVGAASTVTIEPAGSWTTTRLPGRDSIPSVSTLRRKLLPLSICICLQRLSVLT